MATYRLCRARSVCGYSLFELLITITLASTLMAIAIPSFASIMNNTRLLNTSLEVSKSLAIARNGAITANRTVLMCRVSENDENQCATKYQRNSSWANGWLVYIDNNANNTYDDSDYVLNRAKASKRIGVVFNQSGRLRFFPNGSSRSAGFYVCAENAESFRHIKLLYTGRARVEQSSQSDRATLCKNTIK